jgi:hypothetical protein
MVFDLEHDPARTGRCEPLLRRGEARESLKYAVTLFQ